MANATVSMRNYNHAQNMKAIEDAWAEYGKQIQKNAIKESLVSENGKEISEQIEQELTNRKEEYEQWQEQTRHLTIPL